MNTRLVCPQCNADIPASNISEQKLIALCPDCRMVFNFHSQKDQSKNKSKSLPSNLFVEETTDCAAYTFAWRQFGDRILLAMIMLWTISGLCAGCSFISYYGLWSVPTMPILISLIGFGSWMTYQALALVSNQTTLMITPQIISVESTPFDVKTKRAFDANDITDILYKYKPHNGIFLLKNAFPYSLWIVDHNNGEQHLLNVCDETTAFYLSQRIKNYLDLSSVT